MHQRVILICLLLFGFAGKKAYGDWEIAEVLQEFLHKRGKTYNDITRFNFGEWSSKAKHFSILVKFFDFWFSLVICS